MKESGGGEGKEERKIAGRMRSGANTSEKQDIYT